MLLALLLSTANAAGQTSKTTTDRYAGFFREIEDAAQKSTHLWGKNLYSGILLVNPSTRQIIANEGDTAGMLQRNNLVYLGSLPKNINIANTALHWAGKDWAMIMLPLPAVKADRINLLGHELFHRHQPGLGFEMYNPENNHLDDKKGRIYLRLELEALKKAVQAQAKAERKQHLTAAFIFRKYRHLLYPAADSTENLLELNEGLAEYTGFMMSNRSEMQSAQHFENSINSFLKNPTYVRSFAYHTIPVYGYLLHQQQQNWQEAIHKTSDLSDYFISAFDLAIPEELVQATAHIADLYHGKQIFLEEAEREEHILIQIAAYKRKFVEQPHFEISFERMNVSFDPRNIMPLEDKGTVYPAISVTDNWGILKVEKGALMSPNWDKISLTNPTTVEAGKIAGDGWTLDLTDGYLLVRDESNGSYKLVKKE